MSGQGWEMAYTTLSGFPAGAKVFEVMSWHEDEPTPTPQQLAIFRRQVREWNRPPGGKP
jgi:hypothetical protein